MNSSPRDADIGVPSFFESLLNEEYATDLFPELERQEDFDEPMESLYAFHGDGTSAQESAATSLSMIDVHTNNDLGNTDYLRPFPCLLAIYGCTSTLNSKDDWKSHVHAQHLRLGYWRCEQCSLEDRVYRKPTVFNRKDLFMEHVRRMHPFHTPAPSRKKSIRGARSDASDEYYLNEASRCYQYLRGAPESSSCVFCDQHFRGPSSWGKLMEHIGRHMENAKRGSEPPITPASWGRDEEMETWLLQERIIERRGDQLVLAAADSAKYDPVHMESQIGLQHPTSRAPRQKSSALSRTAYTFHDYQTAQLDPVAEVLTQTISPDSNDKNDNSASERQCEELDNQVDEELPIDPSSQLVSGRLSRLAITAKSLAAGHSPAQKPLANGEDQENAMKMKTTGTSRRNSVNTSGNVDVPRMRGEGVKCGSLRAATRCFVCGQGLGTSTVKAHINLSENSACRAGYLTLSRNLQRRVAELLRARYHEQEKAVSRAYTPAESCMEEDSSDDDAHEALGDEHEVPPSSNDTTSDADLHNHGQSSEGAGDGEASAASSSSSTKAPDVSGPTGSACNQQDLDQDPSNTDDRTTQQAKSRKRKRSSVEDRGVRCICCVHEGIEGKRYENLATMHRHVQSRHDTFICQRCFTILENKEQFLDHYHGRDPCSPHCRKPSCQRYLRASCSWRLVSDSCDHLETRDEQWWAAYNVLYNPDAEQATKQGRIDFSDVSNWDDIEIPLENIEAAYEQIAMAEKDAKIADLEQNVKTISENMQTVTQELQDTMRNLQDMTAKSHSQQHLLYTLWQKLCASGCTDTYLWGLVQRTAPELLGLDEQNMSDTTRWKGKQAAVGPVIQNDEPIFGIDPTLIGFEESPADSGVWPGP